MYIGTQPYSGIRARHTYTATAGQTSFSGAGAENVTLTYADELYIDVYQNGVKLSPADYTATSGTTVVLGTGATVSDIIEVIKYDAFSVADTVSAKDGGGFGGNISTSGTLAVTGTSTLTGNTTVGGTLDVTGVATATTFEPDGDTAAGDNAAIGYTAAEGLILTGQGSTSDITVKNDADATVFTVPTGTDDILFPDNAKILLGAGSDLQIFHDGSNSNIDDAGTGPLRISSNGTGIDFNKGTSETMAKFKTDGAVELYHDGTKKIETAATGVTSAGTYIGTVAGSASAPNFAITSGSLGANGMFTGGANTVAFAAGGATKMSITANTVQINQTSHQRARLDIVSNLAAYTHIQLQNDTDNTGGVFIAFARHNAATIGSISQNDTATVFNTSSDYRLKENVNYTFDATTELKKLKPAKFNFIGSSNTVEGFLAHEVQDIVPLAITGVKDGTRDIGTIKDKDGNVLNTNAPEVQKEDGQTWTKTGTEDVIQGIDQSKLVPLLVKSLQEALIEIDTLKTKVTALENA